MPVFLQKKKDFLEHMEKKAKTWNPTRIFKGGDFCVFEFEFIYQHDNASSSAIHWIESYNYSLCSDGDKRLTIINKTVYSGE